MTPTRPDGLLPCGYNGRAPERGWGGLSRPPGKRVGANPPRGFESRPLRQNQSKPAPQSPAPYTRRGFFIGDALEMLSMIAQNTPCRHRASQASIMVSGMA